MPCGFIEGLILRFGETQTKNHLTNSKCRNNRENTFKHVYLMIIGSDFYETQSTVRRTYKIEDFW